MSEPRSITEPDAVTGQTQGQPLSFRLDWSMAGERQDKILAQLLPEHSRARLQAWIAEGRVSVDGQQLPAKARLQPGMRIEVSAPAPEPVLEAAPQSIDFPVIYEDEALLVINKPAGLTVHPGAGQPDGTLMNGLLHHRPALAEVPRAGIVHRLDKDTTGLMVVAATLEVQTALVRALQAREIKREYRALVWGVPVAGGTIDQPLGRHPRDRTRYVVRPGGREAVTYFRVLEKFRQHSLIGLQLETGRTHQIRVHMQHLGFPLVGDPSYGRRGDPYRKILQRQALHACALGLTHPLSGVPMHWEAPMPPDMQKMMDDWRDKVD